MIDNFKFAFILCTNNPLYLNECIHYLNHLLIPDGFEIEIVTISDAASMTSGYNKGMYSSNAKYKIYLHQDVFLINRYFLYDILSIFQSDSSIGLLGVVGYPTVSQTGFMWYENRVGVTDLYGVKHSYPNADYSSYRYSPTDGICDVSLLDGLLLATAHDLPWNDTDLKGWDFYDAFQCMEFLLHGYRVVVPIQKLPWFIHDDGKYVSLWDYDKYRNIFVEKYSKYLGKNCHEIRNCSS